MEKKLMMIRHDTSYKTYRRAGLCFYQDSQPYEVTAEQLEILQNDPRIVMHEVMTAKKPVKKGINGVSPNPINIFSNCGGAGFQVASPANF